MLITTLGYDSYRGVTATGRIAAGRLTSSAPLARISQSGEIFPDVARYLYLHQGLERVEVETASAGEIVVIAGLEDAAIGETLGDPEQPVPLPTINIEEPTVRMIFGVNASPFAGHEGRWGTSRKLRERLFNELRTNVSLRVEDGDSADAFTVSGRGELHLAILIETMRREGYEFQVSRPEVILRNRDGVVLEPYEEVYIELTPESVGVVVEMLGKRRGQMLDLREDKDDTVRLRYLLPTQGLLGFRHHFMSATRGAGFMHSIFHDYLPISGSHPGRSRGSLVAWEQGVTTTYGLKNAEERGILFLGPGVEVYEGMVVGENQRPDDLVVNVCKKRHVSNVRQSFREINVRLSPPREMSLDEAIEYLGDDELLEVTPKSLRIRKRILDSHIRSREVKRAKEAVDV
jgi:GTP-binding protein